MIHNIDCVTKFYNINSVNMENLKKIFEWTKSLPICLRVIVYFMIAGLVLIASLSVSACGATTKATIRNFADSTSTTVTITTNNPTDWNVTPDVSLPLAHDRVK